MLATVESRDAQPAQGLLRQHRARLHGDLSSPFVCVRVMPRQGDAEGETNNEQQVVQHWYVSESAFRVAADSLCKTWRVQSSLTEMSISSQSTATSSASRSEANSREMNWPPLAHVQLYKLVSTIEPTNDEGWAAVALELRHELPHLSPLPTAPLCARQWEDVVIGCAHMPCSGSSARECDHD